MTSTGWRTEKTRRPRSEVQEFVHLLTQEMPKDLTWHLGGSWSRGAPFIGDIDVVLVTESGTMEDIELPKSFEVERRGPKISQGDLLLGEERMHLDFWSCSPKELGAFMMFITGPKELNIAQRQIAISKGYNLSQVGLLKDGVQIDDGTEEDIYRILDMPWLEPTQRQAFAAPKPAEATHSIEREVEGSKGATYTVTIQGDNGSCTCPHHTYRGAQCKHIKAVRESL